MNAESGWKHLNPGNLCVYNIYLLKQNVYNSNQKAPLYYGRGFISLI